MEGRRPRAPPTTLAMARLSIAAAPITAWATPIGGSDARTLRAPRFALGPLTATGK